MDRQVELSESCFKIDKTNAKAMIKGFPKDGELRYQAIWCDIDEKPLPMLITLNQWPSQYKRYESEIGKGLKSNSFSIPYKYIAKVEKQYFIKNDMKLWKTICNNGLFDIWQPIAPSERYKKLKTEPSKYRILLLRIYEIWEEFDPREINIARKDTLKAKERRVTIKKPVIDDVEFTRIKSLLEHSIRDYQISKVTGKPSSGLVKKAKRKFENILPQEVPPNRKFPKGATKRVTVNRYERDRNARRICVHHYGLNCSVCNFKFRDFYGELGEYFIHVHHLIPMKDLEEGYEVDPIEDLRPVCPNCHAMLHQEEDPLSIEDLRRKIQATASRESMPVKVKKKKKKKKLKRIRRI
jgi:hypothetical protein